MGGEHVALDIGAVLAVVLIVVIAVFVAIAVRRWMLERSGGWVECSMRMPDPDRRPRSGGRAGVWRLGIGRYNGDELHWFAIFGLRMTPRLVIHRRGFIIAGRRSPVGEEAAALPADATILEVRDQDRPVELAMSAPALTGFVAWLEAAPPGFPVDVH